MVVADTGAVDAVRKYQPVDCTTNPSLVFGALNDPAYKDLIAVSTEVDARLSFDTTASVARAREITADYTKRDVGKDRILIKLAST